MGMPLTIEHDATDYYKLMSKHGSSLEHMQYNTLQLTSILKGYTRNLE